LQRKKGWGERNKKQKTKEGKTRINVQAEESRDGSQLPGDVFGFVTNLIKSAAGGQI
jgi:hypothetical protein